MKGNPKYEVNDVVEFELDEGLIVQGYVFVVDKYGVFEDNSDVYYDVFVESMDNLLVKHIKEPFIIRKIGHKED